jgi:hypothetical protein
MVVLGLIAAFARLLLFLLMHTGGGGHAADATAIPSKVPSWPIQPGDVLPFRPGDANIARWAAVPTNDDFTVSRVVPGGDPAVPNTTLRVFAPDYIVQTGQPGGTLTVLGHDLIVGWRVPWQGSDTVAADLKKPDFDPNCGRDTDLLLTATQVHDLIAILSGQPKPPPEPDGVPAGTVITLPVK